jgi:ABC-type spermidine/putrescine transport system permease subunit II
MVATTGLWMQRIAQDWLVLELTGSVTAVGVAVALQFLPVLLFGMWGGVIADRYPKRRILYVTQSLYGLLGVAMGLLVITDVIRLWMVYALGVALGLVMIFDSPARPGFVREMVGPERITNAVSLSSTQFNLARVIGPALAGVLVATLGLGAVFVIDGLSYLPAIAMLGMIRSEELQPTVRVIAQPGQLRAGLRYVRRTPVLLNTLLMMAIVGMFTYEFSVMLPLFSEFTFDAGAGGFAAMTAAMGAGAVVGGLFTASRRTSAPRLVVITGALFGLSVMATALMPTLVLAVAMFPGIAIISPLYLQFSDWGLINHKLALILPNVTFTLPICIWTLNAFFRDLPAELEEAARVDGCTRLQVFTQIVTPLAAPGVFTAAILLFIAAWNEFLFARTFMSVQDQYTAPVAIAQFEGADIAAATPWGEISAAAVAMTLPLVLLVLLFQRRIIAGLTAGAVKG